LLNYETTERLLADPAMTQRDKILICLATGEDTLKPVKQVVQIAVESGWPQIRKLNVSSSLSRMKGLVVRKPQGWDVTDNGKRHLRNLTGGTVATLANSLRIQLDKLSDAQTRTFVEEAVACYEAHHYRAAVVLSWVGAVSMLYNHVISKNLQSFNAAAARKNPKWKVATTSDDLARMKESEFLEVCESASILGKSTKQELLNALTFRNGCGHPNSLKLGEHRVSAHIESLILNVFAVY